MASPVGHTLGGLTLLLLARARYGGPLFPLAASAGMALAANAPDLDFIPGILTENVAGWHHGFTHSIFFALLVSGCVLAGGVLQRSSVKAAGRASLAVGGALMLHLALDLVTEDTFPPFGMQILWPFSRAYVLAPLTLLDSVQRGALGPELLGSWAMNALAEGALMGAPLAAVAWWRRREQRTGVRQAG